MESLGGGVAGDDEWLVGDDLDDGPSGPDDAVKEVLLDGEGEYLLRSLPTTELVFTEILQNKSQGVVLEAIRGIVARIAGLGYRVSRIHSDKGREFMAKSVQSWASARGYVWSNTGADNWKANGRVESCIGRLKGMTTTLLSCSGLGSQDWGFAWRHAAERLLPRALYGLGRVASDSLVPFGTKLLVKQRSWRVKDWSPKVVPAVVLAPARQVANAWLVRTDSGDFVTTAVIFPNIVDPGTKEDAKQADDELVGSVPARRYRQKTTAKALVSNQAPGTPSTLPIPNQAPGTPSTLPLPNQAPGTPSTLPLTNQAPRTPSTFPLPNQAPRPSSPSLTLEQVSKTPANNLTTNQAPRTPSPGSMAVSDGALSDRSDRGQTNNDPSRKDISGRGLAKLGPKGVEAGEAPAGAPASASVLVAPSIVCELPSWGIQNEEMWNLPQGCSSNEETLRREDVVAQSLALGSVYRFGRACHFVRQSLWSRTSTGAIQQSQRTELHRVLGMYQHGGVVGITKNTQHYPGFTRLLARMVQDCWPNDTFTSLALVSCADVPPHRDKFNIPGCNFLLPLRLPRGGLCLWSELRKGDLVTGSPATRLLPSGRVVSGQEHCINLGQMAQLDARRWHAASSAGSGSTLCLIAYSLTSHPKLSPELISSLQAFGFRLPAAVTQQGGGDVSKGVGQEAGDVSKGVGQEAGAQAEGDKKISKVQAPVRDGLVSTPGPVARGSSVLSECWCAERACAVCTVKYAQESENGDSGLGIEVWDEGDDQSWFLVDSDEVALRRVSSIGCSDSDDWELVASEVPFGGKDQGRDMCAQELDDLQHGLKSFMSSERPRFRIGFDASDQEEVLGTAVSLCKLSQTVRALEHELAQLRGLGLDGEAVVGDRVEEPVEVLQTRTIPTDQALAEWDNGWGEAAAAEVDSLVSKKQALENIRG